MAILGFELDEIQQLIILMDQQHLKELVLEENGKYIRLRGPNPKPAHVSPAQQIAALPARLQIASADVSLKVPATRVDDANLVSLVSPMVGVFYRSEKPGAPSMVNVGDHVSVEQTVGILEAMKVFSEFKSEHEGVIVKIPVADGRLVHTGDVLMVLRKDQAGS